MLGLWLALHAQYDASRKSEMVLLLMIAAVHATPWKARYSAINVWPMPTGVTLPSPALGPHAVKISAPTVSSTCGVLRARQGACGLISVPTGIANDANKTPSAGAW